MELAYEADDAPPEAPFEALAVLPEPGDNVAIARTFIAAGTRIRLAGGPAVLSHALLEGHRFAVEPMAPGEHLLSWGLPFGRATAAIAPGAYVANARMLQALAGRDCVDFALPAAPNFEDAYLPQECAAQTAPQVPLRAPDERATFLGYPRADGRGSGTRNYVIVVGTTGLTAGVARAAAAQCTAPPGLDGVVAVAHSEGAAAAAAAGNNVPEIVRVLDGCVAHPNVAAAVVVFYGHEAVTGEHLRAAPHARMLRLAGDDFAADVAAAAAAAAAAAELAAAGAERQPCPAADLQVALQCGGSDAFSGVSGNPLAGAVAKTLIEHGGRAVLAETDELIGAEPYVLQRVAGPAVADAFLGAIARFRRRVELHGASAEGNPSGGNNLRGLYNIALKSLGAAKKKHVDVRLDGVLEYAQPPPPDAGRGYFFMDSPGNDIESVTGQVAAGSNLIFFTTGNGSVTNFPFVPTVKIITTSARHAMLAADMDVNAGRFQDGEPLEALAAELFETALGVASGERTRGELAGHSQVAVWRDWSGEEGVTPEPEAGARREVAAGGGLQWAPPPGGDCGVALVLPTSLCSGEVAALAARRLGGRAVALPHTEGCGAASAGTDAHIFDRVMLGHLLHPLVTAAALLEHGCEKTHNDHFRAALQARGRAADEFGWASVQLDGGIERALERVCAYLPRSPPAPQPCPLVVALACPSGRPPPAAVGAAMAHVARAAAATLVLSNDALLRSAPFLDDLLEARASALAPTTAFAQPPAAPGVHIMSCTTTVWAEGLAGLVAGGALVVLMHAVAPASLPVHPFVPVVVVAGDADGPELLQRAMAARVELPAPNAAFQITRGLSGVSM